MATLPRSAASRLETMRKQDGVDGGVYDMTAKRARGFGKSPSEVPAEPIEDAESAEFVENDDGSVAVTMHGLVPEGEVQEDGSVVIDLDEGAAPKRDSEGEDFLVNLAEVLEDDVLSTIARDILDAIEIDKEDRKERDHLYAEGLKRTGLGKDVPAGAAFEGSSNAVYPLLVEGCVDFAARTMKEIFPPKGPVKTHIVGKSNRQKIEKAERKRKFMNWQCTRQIKEMRSIVEETLTQVPLGGSQFIKVWYDERVGRPRLEFIPVDRFFMPFAATSLYSAERKTHWQTLTGQEFMSRVENGLYTDLGLSPDTVSTVEKSAAEKANDKIEGRSETGFSEDGQRDVYECYLNLELEGDTESGGAMAPYIATVDHNSGRLLALYRNWAPDDERLEELEWIVEAKFVVWRGAYGLGLIHLAGSLSAAATGSLRALLDAALIQNFPGALALKGARMAGQNVKSDPTQIAQIEGPTGVDDIRKVAMPYPFNGPSVVLFELLKFVAETGKGVINTAEERISEAQANMPVGTTLALIEQGSLTYSAIHSRMHEMMARILAILHRIDAQYLDDEETVEELGEEVVYREDFQGPMDVVPVSDPNIFSETQRYAQLQAALQLREQFGPQAFKDSVLLEQAFRLLNYPNYEEILNTPLEAIERTASEENIAASEPQSQLQAYETQDHFAHLETHIRFMSSPIFCANPFMAPIALPKLMEHCKQHILELYRENMEAASRAFDEAAGELDLNNEDKKAAAAAATVDQELAKTLGPIFEQLQKLQQQMAQLIPPPPDPALAVENARAQASALVEKERLAYKAQEDRERRAAEEASEQRRLQHEAQVEERRVATEAAAAAAEAQAAAARHTEEMAIAARNAEIAELSEQRKQDVELILAKMHEEFETIRNSQDNKTAIVVAKLQEALKAATPEEGQAAAPKGDVTNMIMEAMVSLLRTQSEPRAYAIRRTADNSLELVSSSQQPSNKGSDQ